MGTHGKTTRGGAWRNPRKLLALACALLLAVGTLPLYAIAFANHPYYDDYSFSGGVRQVWQQTRDPLAVLGAAVAGAREVRANWQGTYTGTFLSHVQPGVFAENLYWITTFLLLTAYLLGFGFFFTTVLRTVLRAGRAETVAAGSLTLLVSVQFLPAVNEAFFWFNGGVGNVFIYALLAVALGLSIRLWSAKRGAPWLMLALAVLMVLLGGGSYGGGLFGLLIFAAVTVFAFVRNHRFRMVYAALTALFLACFVYSAFAPGNAQRALLLAPRMAAPEAIAKSLYYGAALIGNWLILPVAALMLGLAPLLYRLAAGSRFRFRHPLWVVALAFALFCAQLTPPLYAGVFLGGGRILNTYFVSFVPLLLVVETYLLGALASRRAQRGQAPLALTATARRGLLLGAACLFCMGCLGYRQAGDTLYGPMNMAGGRAALSIVTGEAARYDREMRAREALLNDPALAEVTLAPLTATPRVFMEDLLAPGALYDVRPALCRYYGKTAITVEGSETP